jgi:ferredoxin-NADP reductase
LSFSSSAERASDGALEFTIKALGDWSGAVPRIAEGARAWVDGPFGAFTPDRTDARAFALVAGGIGVSPMRSMLLTFRDRGERRPIVLFYAANRPERTVFRAELERLERELDLEVVYVYESPPAGWEGERGRVTADVLLRHLRGDLSSWQFFVCGPPPMMDDLELVLRRIGVEPGHVHTERFDLV